MKKRKIICLSVMLIAISTLLLVFSFGIVYTPLVFFGEPVWTIQTGGIVGIEHTDDAANVIAVYPRGSRTTHVYVAGYKGEDGWIAKYRDTGSTIRLLWEVNVNSMLGASYSRINDIALALGGTYIYAVGSYSLTGAVDDCNTVLIILSATDGSVISSYTLDAFSFFDGANAVVIVPLYGDTYVYITGGVLDSTTSDDPYYSYGSIFIAKLRGGITADPEFLWVNTYESPVPDNTFEVHYTDEATGNDIGYLAGSLYLVGQVTSSIFSDSGYGCWVAKVNSIDGTLIWYIVTPISPLSKGRGITIDRDSSIWVCGHNVEGNNVLFLKYNTEGRLLSAMESFNGYLAGRDGDARKILALPDGGVASTGSICSASDSSDYDIFVQTPLWSDTVNGAGGFDQTDYGNAITTNAAGEIYVAGSIRSLNPSSGVMHDDIWIRKYRTRVRRLRID